MVQTNRVLDINVCDKHIRMLYNDDIKIPLPLFRTVAETVNSLGDFGAMTLTVRWWQD